VKSIVFTPNGEIVAPIAYQSFVNTQRLDVDVVANMICDEAGDPITEQEWERYLPDLPYDPPCD